MLIFIPMAGFGDRYIKAGYVEPKPLIPVDGVPMIERVIAGFRQGVPDAKFLFCINRKHAELPAVREKISNTGAIVSMAPPEKFALQVREETVKWGKMVRDLDLKATQ